MKEAYWGYWLVVLGIFIIVVLLLIQNFTSTNSQDFYLVKEIAEAAMEDAVDMGYYREYGEPKINKEKFYESFIRRFAEEASISTTYDIEFTEVYEAPPKIGVKVSSKAHAFTIVGDSESFDIVNKLDAILEATTKDVVSTSSSSVTMRRYAGDYHDYDDYISSVGLESEFAGQVCHYALRDSSILDVEVYKCGMPTTEGIADRQFEEGGLYCVAYSADTDDILEGTYAKFKELQTQGKCN